MPRLYRPDSLMSRRLRQMYAGGRGDAVARRYARLWATVFGLGVLPSRWVTLEVRGRRSGEIRRFPLGLTWTGGHEYLVSMLGECAWTRNVRAADGKVVLRGRHTRAVRLVEVPVRDRAPVIKAYVDQVPGGRPHIPVPPGRPTAAYQGVAGQHPVFEVLPQ